MLGPGHTVSGPARLYLLSWNLQAVSNDSPSGLSSHHSTPPKPSQDYKRSWLPTGVIENFYIVKRQIQWRNLRESIVATSCGIVGQEREVICYTDVLPIVGHLRWGIFLPLFHPKVISSLNVFKLYLLDIAFHSANHILCHNLYSTCPEMF